MKKKLQRKPEYSVMEAGHQFAFGLGQVERRAIHAGHAQVK